MNSLIQAWHIALRSWKLVPFAYYIRGKRNALELKKEEFEFLFICDGKTELPSVDESPFAELLSGSRYLDEVCITLRTLHEKNSKCGMCEHFEHCNDGCRAVALALTRDKPGIDPTKCLFGKEEYDKKIAELLPDYQTVL